MSEEPAIKIEHIVEEIRAEISRQKLLSPAEAASKIEEDLRSATPSRLELQAKANWYTKSLELGLRQQQEKQPYIKLLEVEIADSDSILGRLKSLFKYPFHQLVVYYVNKQAAAHTTYIEILSESVQNLSHRVELLERDRLEVTDPGG